MTHFTPVFHFSLPWKQKTQRFSNVFRGYRNGTSAWNGLMNLIVFCEAIFFDIKKIKINTKSFLTIGERTLCNHLYQSPKYKESSSIISKTYSRTCINLQALSANIIRSNHRRYSIKNVFLKISKNSYENTCARVSLLTLLKKRLSYFPLNFAKFWKTTFLQNTSGRLLIKERLSLAHFIHKSCLPKQFLDSRKRLFR